MHHENHRRNPHGNNHPHPIRRQRPRLFTGHLYRRASAQRHGASMKNPPNKPICDAVMYHIGKVSAESANPAGKKFGRKMLRDTITMWLDNLSQLEFNVAIQWLIDNNYLKPLGQHTVGIGTGKDIKKYNLNGYAPYKTVNPEHLTADSAVADGEDNTPPPKVITAAQIISEAFNDKPANPFRSNEAPAIRITVPDTSAAETEPKGQNTFRCPADYRDITADAIEDVPSFITKETTEFQQIEQSLNTLKAKLNGKSIDKLNIKLRTLAELSRLLDPEISNVLNQIHDDLKEIAQ